jgi:hypothetical protein
LQQARVEGKGYMDQAKLAVLLFYVSLVFVRSLSVMSAVTLGLNKGLTQVQVDTDNRKKVKTDCYMETKCWGFASRRFFAFNRKSRIQSVTSLSLV